LQFIIAKKVGLYNPPSVDQARHLLFEEARNLRGGVIGSTT